MRNIEIFRAFAILCIAASVGKCRAAKTTFEEDIRKLASANNELAVNLHRELVYGSSKNVFFSPFSISTALGMLLLGARGETNKELRKILGYEKSALKNGLIHITFARYFRNVLNSEDSSDGYVLNSANAILVEESLELLERYRNYVQKLYRAPAVNVDFANDAPELVEEINDWVKEETNGKIEYLLDDLSTATVLVLLNAVYFKGTWETPFNPDATRDEIFYNNGQESEAKNVPMMNLKGEFPMSSFSEFQVLELPYKGENISMLILLPNELDGLSALEESLTPEELAMAHNEAYPTNVEISLPKFKLEFEEDLSEPLKAIGANQIFTAGADFSGMTQSGSVSVSEILHKAVIEVNEEGSEAAAVTEVMMSRNRPIPFRVDHPFWFVILEKGSKSNMVLFMGRVNNL